MRQSRHLQLVLWLCVTGMLTTHEAMAVKFTMQAAEKQCFDESIGDNVVNHREAEGLQITGAIQVLENNSHENRNSRRSVDVTVTSPVGRIVWQQKRVWKQAIVDLKARDLGKYTLCFYNTGPARLELIVVLPFFSVMHVEAAKRASSPAKVTVPKGDAVKRSEELAQHTHLTQVHDCVIRMQEMLEVSQGEQEYYKTRLLRHIATAEDTHWRTYFYPTLEIIIIAAMAAVQTVVIHVLFQKRSYKRQYEGV